MLLTSALAAALLTAPLSPPDHLLTVAVQQADPVTFERRTMADGDTPVEIGVWSPSTPSAAPRPLVVISHGNGGDFRGHEDTARALAAAGFVVAALTHTGDSWRDQSGATDVARRPRQLSLLVETMVAGGGVDADRVGAFGFSAGGFTVLTAAGGEPDMGRVADHCRAHPDFYDCRLIASVGLPANGAPVAWTHNPRIKAVVAAAPALGFTFAPDGLKAVTGPVQLWQAEDDRILPAPVYVEPVRAALPTPPEFHLVPGAGHFDFLPPCRPEVQASAPMICVSAPDFDRAAFHDRLNAEVVRFFRRTLMDPAA
ncbi:alpha/beta hydrolase family protein [Brevundimonas sp.]|uniref:alpha/beta hydrolase family protein n=1 Tax=Brevundimonas sp. TaxID=1871086 RepID=UPI002EDB111E